MGLGNGYADTLGVALAGVGAYITSAVGKITDALTSREGNEVKGRLEGFQAGNEHALTEVIADLRDFAEVEAALAGLLTALTNKEARTEDCIRRLEARRDLGRLVSDEAKLAAERVK